MQNIIKLKRTLRNSIDRKIGISDKEFDKFFTLFKTIEVQKREFLLTEGEKCKHYFFVTEGLTRTFYIDSKGKEVITSFAIENWWLTDIESFINRKRSSLSIQAIEPTKVLAITYEDLEKSYMETPSINTFFRMLTQNMVVAIQKRHNFYMKAEGKDRYEFIVQCLPEFVQRIPLRMLASYIGITPEHLSELRKNRA